MCCERNNGEISDEKWEQIQELWGNQCDEYTVIPTLPDDLRDLYCCNTNVDYLPLLPARLEFMDCSYTKISHISLPDSLTWLDCGYTRIRQLPPLPITLELLDCRGTNMIQLPPLPAGLQILYFCDTNVTRLPNIPIGLEHLDCGNTWVEHPSNPTLSKNLAILVKVQRKIKNKLYLHRLSKQNLLKKIFSPQITQLILSY